MKLASELQRVATGNTLYVLDEPTTGLHTEDIKRLIGVLQRLVDAGNTIVVIEHNLDVIKTGQTGPIQVLLALRDVWFSSLVAAYFLKLHILSS